MTDPLAAHRELFFGLVAPIGVDRRPVIDALSEELRYYEYDVLYIKLSELLKNLQGSVIPDDSDPVDERINALMNAGNRLREDWGRGDAFALLAMGAVQAERLRRDSERSGERELPASLGRVAVIFDSLKHEEEIETLRAVYGSHFFVVGAYASPGERLTFLSSRIASSRRDRNASNWEMKAKTLFARDEKEDGDYGQQVRDTFHRADFFVETGEGADLHVSLKRFVEIIFGHPFRTPQRGEFALFQAVGAARRSAEPGRQVGAAIVDDFGSVIALGVNEVPSPGGGQYWDDDESGREFTNEFDSNAKRQQELAKEIETALREDGLLADEMIRPDDVLRSIMSTRLKSITEFGRAVHAEMSALMDAARRGISVQGTTMYVTTFPCHTCARHLIAAGVSEVVYIEPYPKSATADLHRDAVRLEGEERTGPDDLRTEFRPFVGLAPGRYLELFDASWREKRPEYLARKNAAGRMTHFGPKSAFPVLADLEVEDIRVEVASYRLRELRALDLLEELWSSRQMLVKNDHET